jgi:hypothetical protein
VSLLRRQPAIEAPTALPPPQRLQHPHDPALAGLDQGTPAGIDLSAFEVPEGMVVSSITLSPAVTTEVEDEELASEEEVEEARRSGR